MVSVLPKASTPAARIVFSHLIPTPNGDGGSKSNGRTKECAHTLIRTDQQCSSASLAVLRLLQQSELNAHRHYPDRLTGTLHFTVLQRDGHPEKLYHMLVGNNLTYQSCLLYAEELGAEHTLQKQTSDNQT